MIQGRDNKGHFSSKGDEPRLVRSLRLTDSTWEKLGTIAHQRGITRADLIEEMVSGGDLVGQKYIDLSAIVSILESALKLKANAGGAIKEKIRKVLVLINL